MDGTGAHRPIVIKIFDRLLVVVGDHDAVDRLDRVRGPPTDDIAFPALLVANIPYRLGLFRQICNRADATSCGAGLTETMDAVFPSTFTCADTSPQHGREDWTDGGQIAPDAFIHELLECRHFTLLNERAGYIPIGGIPANEEDFSVGHSKKTRISSLRIKLYKYRYRRRLIDSECKLFRRKKY